MILKILQKFVLTYMLKGNKNRLTQNIYSYKIMHNQSLFIHFIIKHDILSKFSWNKFNLIFFKCLLKMFKSQNLSKIPSYLRQGKELSKKRSVFCVNSMSPVATIQLNLISGLPKMCSTFTHRPGVELLRNWQPLKCLFMFMFTYIIRSKLH